MAVPNVEYKPKGYHTVTPYLTVADPQKTIDFCQQVLDAQLIFAHKEPEGNVAHAELRIEDSMIMTGQARGKWQPIPSALYVYIPDVDTTYKKAIAFGAKSEMEPADQFYGDRTAGVVDANGTHWWFGTHIEDVSPEEMQRRAAEVKQVA